MRDCAWGGSREAKDGISFSSTLWSDSGGLLCALPLDWAGALPGETARDPKISSGEADEPGLLLGIAGLPGIRDGRGRGRKLSARLAIGFPSSMCPALLGRVPRFPLALVLRAPSGTSRLCRLFAMICSPAPNLPSCSAGFQDLHRTTESVYAKAVLQVQDVQGQSECILRLIHTSRVCR